MIKVREYIETHSLSAAAASFLESVAATLPEEALTDAVLDGLAKQANSVIKKARDAGRSEAKQASALQEANLQAVAAAVLGDSEFPGIASDLEARLERTLYRQCGEKILPKTRVELAFAWGEDGELSTTTIIKGGGVGAPVCASSDMGIIPTVDPETGEKLKTSDRRKLAEKATKIRDDKDEEES